LIFRLKQLEDPLSSCPYLHKRKERDEKEKKEIDEQRGEKAGRKRYLTLHRRGDQECERKEEEEEKEKERYEE